MNLVVVSVSGFWSLGLCNKTSISQDRYFEYISRGHDNETDERLDSVLKT